MREPNEKYQLSLCSREGTARSSFSAKSFSRNVLESPNISKRAHTAPIGRQANRSQQVGFEHLNPPNIPTISASIENSSNDVDLSKSHITPTHYRPETARSTNTSILVTPPDALEDTIPSKYEPPPLAEEEYLEGKERQRSAPPSSNSNRRMSDFERGAGCGGCSLAKKCLIFGGVALFFIILTISIFADSIHTISEGNVGIYYVRGALSDEYTLPGTHWAVPFVTDVQEITIRPVTSTLERIRTITRDGIGNTFDNIQVISDVDSTKLIPLIKRYGIEFRDALIFDRISEELRIFCANHTVDEVYNSMFLDIVKIIKNRVTTNIKKLLNGDESVKIMNLVIPKPEIPQDIARNYKQVKIQWTEQLVAQQSQKTDKIKKETQSIIAILDAEREKKVLAIEIEKDILQKEGEKNLSTLNNLIIKEREESKANVENYRKTQEAEANARLYTKEFVRLEMAKSLSTNTKFFFSGESSPLGAVLSKLMGESK